MRHITACILLAASAGMLTLSGCAIGTKSVADSAAYEGKIIKGKTTQADVRKLLGEPFQTTRQNGSTVWNYSYTDGIAVPFFKNAKVRELNVTFNSRGIVTSYEDTSSN